MARRFLLLNASNYPRNAIYPYAFVQVSALARRVGLDTIRQDLMPFTRSNWSRILQQLLREHDPLLIGVHLRQCDSQFVEEYDRPLFRDGNAGRYFPIEDTKDLISLIKQETDVPVVIGGFGVTNDPVKIFDYVGADFAINGEPDAFFANLDIALERRDSQDDQLSNLIYRSGETIKTGNRIYFDPNSETEYTEVILKDLKKFYQSIGRSVSVGQLGEVDVPVEISRGCPYSCAFCTEPHVKGKETRYRDLDVIFGELEFLSAQDVRSVWLVCSELNVRNSNFAMLLAERMIRFNEERPGREIIWKAYSLPRPVISAEQWKILIRSGHVPGWNGVTSFSDDNLRSMRVPYRSKDAVRYLRSVSDNKPLIRKKTGSDILKVEVFLGNAKSDVASVRESLRKINDSHLFSAYDFKEIIRGTRVYSSTAESLGVTDPAQMETYGRSTERHRYLFPTFCYPPALLAHFGDSRTLIEFFDFVENIVFNQEIVSDDIDVSVFIREYVGKERLLAILGNGFKYKVFAAALAQRISSEHSDGQEEVLALSLSAVEEACQLLTDPTTEAVDNLFSDSMEAGASGDLVLDILADAIWYMSPGVFDRLLFVLDLGSAKYLESSYTQFEIISQLFLKFGDTSDLHSKLSAEFEASEVLEAEFMLLWLLARHNVELRAEYRPFFCELGGELG